ncbi:MAG: glycine cleavage system aminomethyltransferase GcvT [Polyangiaceae bacterium]|nr:glycine cleavage system aminomethyltransferase GcvT [Polyangiaceae bacterium]
MADSLKATPLLDRHRALGGRLVPFAGYEMPVQYSGIVAEHQAVRERAGLFDVSHMGELLLTGEGALEQANRLVTNDLARIADGQAMYTCCCNEQGTILDDLILYRHAPERILVVCNASNRDKIVGHFSSSITGVRFEDQSDETALIALQGPKALQVLGAAELSFDASSLKSFRFQAGTLAGKACTVARTGYTGEDGVEIFCNVANAVAIWDALLEAGKPFEVLPCGLGARDTLRLEARLSLYGNDIDETTNPLEAGLAWTVKFDKAEFVGKAALEAIKAAGLTRKMVGFECTGRGIARHGYPILSKDGERIGEVTSGAPSPTLGKNIGMGYVPAALSEVGSEFVVDSRGRQISAVVVKTPFYKRPPAS